MRVVGRVLRYALSLTCTVVAAWCVYRGMRYLFGFETRPGAGRQVASLAGVGPALGYFVGCLLCLLAAGELFPKPPLERKE